MMWHRVWKVLLLFMLPFLEITTATPRRLHFEGSNVYDPSNLSTPIMLRGFTWMFKLDGGQSNVSKEDRSVSQLLPKTNMARLVMVHWHDTKGKGDCASEDPSTGYLIPACLQMFDEVVKWTTQEADPPMWSIVTARAALAAGDGGPGKTVFTNETLRSQMIAMWSTLAARYKGYDNILGYEVMSEPRTTASDQILHQFHVDACASVWAQDADAACIIGAAQFYNRHNLNASLVLNVSNRAVMYAANFFEPKQWVTGNNHSLHYPGNFPCCDLMEGKEQKIKFCGGNGKVACAKAAPIYVNKSWLVSQLQEVSNFSKKFNVPVWIDQWGVHNDSGSAHADSQQQQDQYLSDVMEAFDQEGMHWADWIWRRPLPWTCQAAFAVICEEANGTYVKNEMALKRLGKYLA